MIRQLGHDFARQTIGGGSVKPDFPIILIAVECDGVRKDVGHGRQASTGRRGEHDDGRRHDRDRVDTKGSTTGGSAGLSPGGVLIAVLAAGINNTDINTRLGWYASSVRAGTGDAPAEAGRSDGGWSGAIPLPLIWQAAEISKECMVQWNEDADSPGRMVDRSDKGHDKQEQIGVDHEIGQAGRDHRGCSPQQLPVVVGSFEKSNTKL
ncbi:MAG: hypothetical protein ACOH2H_24970 [Cypionkella sp.]